MSEYSSGRQASILQGYLSGLLDDGPGESPGPLFKTAPDGFSITGSDLCFILVNEKFSSAGYEASDSMEAAWLS